MRGRWDILADLDLGSIINLLVVAGVAILAALGKAAEKRKQESAARRDEENRQRRQAQGGLPVPPPRPSEQPTPARDLPPVTDAARRDQLRRSRLAQYRRGIQQQMQEMGSPFETEELFSALPSIEVEPEPVEVEPAELETEGPAAPPPPLRRRPIPRRPQPAPRPMVAGGGVDQEMAALQERQRMLEQLREKRLSARAIPEADTAAIESHLLRIRPAVTTSEERRHVSLVDLADPAQARAAIIFHEILAPPKALRSDREMWDA